MPCSRRLCMFDFLPRYPADARQSGKLYHNLGLPTLYGLSHSLLSFQHALLFRSMPNPEHHPLISQQCLLVITQTVSPPTPNIDTANLIRLHIIKKKTHTPNNSSTAQPHLDATKPRCEWLHRGFLITTQRSFQSELSNLPLNHQRSYVA